MLFWLIAFFINYKEDEDDLMQLPKKERQENLLKRICIIIVLIIIAYGAMAAIASSVRQNEKVFNACLYFFMIFLVCSDVAIFLSIMQIVKIEYGDGFKRKVFVEKQEI